jgi:uncharacterized protein (UPF0210 family)
LCSSVNAATTRAGINMDAVGRIGRLDQGSRRVDARRGAIACAKFVALPTPSKTTPLWLGRFTGSGEPEAVINVGVSGPGVIGHAVRHAPPGLPLEAVADLVKKLSF